MRKGIDISKYQQNVDYKKLKEQGIEFAIIRCGYGRTATQKDPLFEEHYRGLKDAGIKVGCYLYSYADNINDGRNEAYNTLKLIEGKKFDLPVFYDLEDEITLSLGKDRITQIAKDFCEVIQSNGYKAGIYANLNWFKNYINVNELLNFYIWLAQWSDNHTADFRVDFWQYSSEGKILGINGFVDLDYDLRNENSIEIENHKATNEIVDEVIKGLWGNGQQRIDKLTNAGYNAKEIQALVNKKVGFSANSSSVSKVYHIVKKGDTLSELASTYGTTVVNIMKLNPSIKNPNLIIKGSRLRIK